MKSSDYNKMPIFMAERHKILHKIYSSIKKNPELVRKIFDFNKTIHADLELSWLDEGYQKKEIGSLKDYQIVIATVKSGQTSDAHLHEKGASSFIVLGKKTGFNEPKKLLYRTGRLDFPSLKVKKLDEINCREGLEIDIPSYIVHQFQNKGDKDACILIVTHPIIDVKEGHEDIHFTFKKS
jgi:quercetin dioxygenase-like cupin family protein